MSLVVVKLVRARGRKRNSCAYFVAISTRGADLNSKWGCGARSLRSTEHSFFLVTQHTRISFPNYKYNYTTLVLLSIMLHVSIIIIIIIIIIERVKMPRDVFEPLQISNRRNISNVLFIFVIHFGGLVHDHLREFRGGTV